MKHVFIQEEEERKRERVDIKKDAVYNHYLNIYQDGIRFPMYSIHFWPVAAV